jgi:hypothetical protein
MSLAPVRYPNLAIFGNDESFSPLNGKTRPRWMGAVIDLCLKWLRGHATTDTDIRFKFLCRRLFLHISASRSSPLVRDDM